MSDESRIFWVSNESDSDPGAASKDEKTIIGLSIDDLPSTTPMPLKEEFTKHYQQIREWLTDQAGRAGVTLLAMSPDAVHGAAFLAAKPDLVSTAIIGRHSKADLRLRDDASLSLRHVALLLFPNPGAGPGCRYRLMDMRSATGFFDERGKRLRAIEADGPAFIRVGHYDLLVFSTGGADEPWPEDPEAGWAQIPARLYLDEVETEEKSREWEVNSDKAWEVDDLPDLSSAPTLVHNIAGPRDGGPRARRRERDSVWRVAHHFIAWFIDDHPGSARRTSGNSSRPLSPLRCRQGSLRPGGVARTPPHH